MSTQQQSLRAISAVPEPAERLVALTKWMSQRMDELAQTESRLDKRLAHLAMTEQGLQKLFDALRTQVAEAHPVLNQLAIAKEHATLAARQVMESLPTAEPTSAAPAAPLRDVDEIAAIEAAAELAERALAARAAELDERIHSTLEAAAERAATVAAQAAADKTAGRLIDDLKHQLALAETVAHDLSRQIDERARDAADRAYRDVDTLTAPAFRKINAMI